MVITARAGEAFLSPKHLKTLQLGLALFPIFYSPRDSLCHRAEGRLPLISRTEFSSPSFEDLNSTLTA